MDLVTQTDLDALAARDLPGDHISLFIPTHRFGAGVPTDRIRWKVLLKKTELALRQRGGRAPQIEELLSPAWTLYEDGTAWQYMSDGLALFLRRDWYRLYRVPASVPEIATLGSRFVTGPLLRTMTEGSHFLVLALSQRKVRLLEGSRQHVEEIELGPDIPTSLREVIEPPESRSETMARPTTSSLGGRGQHAVFYGHGAADEHFKKDEVRRFLQIVAKGLREYLHDQSLPMVLVGLDDLVSAYRGDVDAYPYVVDGDVRQSPDQLNAEQLHAPAWGVAEAFFAQRVAADRQRFEELHGTGRASNDPKEIEDAAAHGRVETLFLAAEPWCWESVSTDGPAVVQLGVDDAFAHCELLDRAATDTWSRGGHVHAIAASAVPGGGDAAAILRY